MSEAADTQSVEPPSPFLPMIEKAMQSGDHAIVSSMIEAHERWEDREAKREFDLAMASFKADPPKLEKNAEVDFSSGKGRTHYWHATLDHIANVISIAMAPHGLSFRWHTSQDGDRIRVTCILAHERGHEESVSLSGDPDQTGNKNVLQQIGSTITYLQRYTLLAIAALAASDQDDDGASAGPQVPKIDSNQLAQLEDMLEATESNVDKFKAWAFAGIPNASSKPLSDLRADQFGPAINLLRQKLDKREGDESA